MEKTTKLVLAIEEEIKELASLQESPDVKGTESESVFIAIELSLQRILYNYLKVYY